MPLVSVIMPTFNRADTIRRAVRSVQAQTFTDWELIVVDDGSTDNTVALIEGCDPRLKLIRQENRGTAGARNAGLSASAGSYIAFLDSDDEWLPHHLELCVSFLEAFPGEQFVTNELWEDLGQGSIVNHYRAELEEYYPRMARKVGSRLLDLPPGEQDDYLRVYQSRQPIGEWGRAIVERTPYQNVFHYRGQIFENMRWGFLMCLPSTVVRREACEAVGLFDTEYYGASDYAFTIELCRRFQANYLSIPACIKHEFAEDGGSLSESHVATGKTALICLQDVLSCLERYWGNRRGDPEISALLGFRQLDAARLALERCERPTALKHIKAARRWRPGLRRARYLQWLITLIPGARFSCQVYIGFNKASYILGMIRRNEMSIGQALGKLARRLFNVSYHSRATQVAVKR
ncbi:MAG TPA: glycosyltransferase family A protein [Blastocatellia bacterium]|nr:glycosyltransferase family A protein [Blastocatellia bacterium]